MKKMLILASLMLAMASGLALAEDAPALYKARCSGCHGADGAKPASTESRAIKGMSVADSMAAYDKYLNAQAPKGQVMIMQGILKKLSPEQRQILANYTAGL